MALRRTVAAPPRPFVDLDSVFGDLVRPVRWELHDVYPRLVLEAEYRSAGACWDASDLA
jgi:hypothetical protein